ncbi:MAG: hypothetical protein ACKV2U_17335 [Bryobacteraceae bacterium]
MNASQAPLREAANSLNDLFEQGLRVSLGLVESMNQMRSSMLTSAMKSGTVSTSQCCGTGMSVGTAKCSCEIPPPCWMPLPLGELTTHVCPGSTATLRIRITNCGNTPRTITVDAKQTTEKIEITPAALNLGPMERGEVTINRPIPASAGKGHTQEALIWVRGCREHYLRWTVEVTDRGGSCCHEIDVSDCPDLVHHWYDHFYCERGCPPRRQQ